MLKFHSFLTEWGPKIAEHMAAIDNKHNDAKKAKIKTKRAIAAMRDAGENNRADLAEAGQLPPGGGLAANGQCKAHGGDKVVRSTSCKASHVRLGTSRRDQSR